MKEQQDHKNRILYHYTDFIAFDGILRNRELRVNNVLNMNDATEMELFMEGIFSAVEKRLVEIKEERKVRQLQVVREKVQELYFVFSVYAACFSSYRDDASQWERYANRGKGVCLGLRQEILEKMTGGAIMLQKVFYQEDMDEHPLVEQAFNLITENETLEDTIELRETLHEAWRNSASFKHPSFSSEHETRLIVMPFEVPDFPLKPRYHVAKDRIKKYYPLDLDTMCLQAGVTMEDLFSEIIVGPESTQSVPILRDYLQDLGLNTLAKKICSSDCPLRSKI